MRSSLKHTYPLLIYGVFLALSRLLFDVPSLQGMGGAEGLWQFLPAKVLTARPLESLLYLHSRPPLANALYALDLHFRLGGRLFTFWNIAAGAALFQFLFRFVDRLCGGTRVALLLFPVAVTLFSLSLLAFIDDILYTFSTAALLLGVAWFAFDYLGAEGTAPLVGFVFCSSLLSLLRESYGIAFLLLVLAVFIVRHGRHALWATPCLVPVVLWCAKNLWVFGFFGTNTLLGQALFLNAGPNSYLLDTVGPTTEWTRIRTDVAGHDARLGALFVGIMHRPADYEAQGFRFTENPRFANIPALARGEGPGWSASNKNAYEYIELSAAFMKLSLKLIHDHPMNYVNNCWIGFRLFLKPSWMYLQTVTHWHNTHPHLFKRYPLPRIDERVLRERGIYVSEGYDLFPLAYALVIAVLLFHVRFPGVRLDRAQALLLLLVIGLGSGAAFMVSNLESMRYKFEIEPLVYGLFFGFIGAMIVTARKRHRHRPIVAARSGS